MTYVRLPKRRKRQRANIREPRVIRCPQHLAWVRGHCCSLMGKWSSHGTRHECRGSIEAAHVRSGTDGGLAMKPSDCWALPLCTLAHQQQHAIGEGFFERMWGVNMKQIASGLARLSPALKRYYAKQERAPR